MNRHERRKRTKLVGDVVELKFGRVVFKPGEDTSRDTCYLCGKPATAWSEMGHGFVDISGHIVLLCESCFNTEEQDKAIIRKYFNAPDMKISEGGTIDDLHEIEQAFAERGDKPTN
jgi:hypothetical protein